MQPAAHVPAISAAVDAVRRRAGNWSHLERIMTNKTPRIRIGVLRNDSSNVNAEMHRQRARLLHSLVETLDIPVENWGNTDTEEPHEFVEIIVALGTAGVFTAVVQVVNAWLERDKIEKVELASSDGKNRIVMTKAKAADVVAVAKTIGYKMPSPTKPPRKRTKA
jgi:RNA-binding protein YhbY